MSNITVTDSIVIDLLALGRVLKTSRITTERAQMCAEVARQIWPTAPAMFARLLVGVGWIESHWDSVLAPDGTGDNHHGHWIFQIDDRSHSDLLAKVIQLPDGSIRPAWRDDRENILMGAGILAKALEAFPESIRAGVDTYNAGSRAERRALDAGRDPDAPTATGHYATQVLTAARIQVTEAPGTCPSVILLSLTQS